MIVIYSKDWRFQPWSVACLVALAIVACWHAAIEIQDSRERARVARQLEVRWDELLRATEAIAEGKQ